MEAICLQVNKDEPLSSGDCVGGRYDLVRVLAQGGTSTIWLANDRWLDRQVVLKSPDLHKKIPHITEELAFYEATLGVRLNHPVFVKTFDLIWDNDKPYLVLEYLEGHTLATFNTRGPLNRAQIHQLLSDLASALHYLHGIGVIHSDLKPSNIIIQPDGSVRLIDLATCRSVQGAPEWVANLSNCSFHGFTPAYSSPQSMADASPSPSDDVYSLAMLLFEAAGGKIPPQSEKEVAEETQLTKPSQLNRFEWQVLKKAMASEASLRLESIQSFAKMYRFAGSRKLYALLMLITLVIFASVIGLVLSSNAVASAKPLAFTDRLITQPLDENRMGENTPVLFVMFKDEL